MGSAGSGEEVGERIRGEGGVSPAAVGSKSRGETSSRGSGEIVEGSGGIVAEMVAEMVAESVIPACCGGMLGSRGGRGGRSFSCEGGGSAGC